MTHCRDDRPMVFVGYYNIDTGALDTGDDLLMLGGEPPVGWVHVWACEDDIELERQLVTRVMSSGSRTQLGLRRQFLRHRAGARRAIDKLRGIAGL